MIRLFSPFDLFIFFLPFIFMLISISLILNILFKSRPLLIFFSRILNILGEFFLSLKPKFLNKSRRLLFLGLFLMLTFCNFFRVFSFNFPLTSQVSLVFWLAGTAWVRIVVFSVYTNFKGFFSHLIPEGTPLPLTALLFIIELVRRLIRPLTLTVRLVANILAGHLLISLLSSLVLKFELTGFLYIGLNLVEIFVALIQAYIFTTMVVLYFSEV